MHDLLSLRTPQQEDKVLFDRLAQLYAYDFRDITDLVIGRDGLFGSHSCFAEMWTDPDRHPYLIFVETEPAGFAIVQWTGKDYDMEQFFVMRKFRRTGLGRAAAYRLFDMFRGPWGIEQIAGNTVAQAFWRNVISGYTDDDFEDTLGDDPMQSFVS